MDEIEITPLHFTRRTVLTVDAWPPYIAITEEWMKKAHIDGASVDGDTVTFAIGNGEATYQLRRDLPKHGKGIVAELVDGNTPASLKARRAKYEAKVT